MPEGCGVGGGLTVLAGDVGAVCVPVWVAVLLAVAVVCVRECVLLAAEAVLLPGVVAVSFFRDVLVATGGAPVVTPGPLVEDTEGVVVFLSAALPEGIAGAVAVLGLSVPVVDSVPAPAWAAVGWPGAEAAWSCSVVCSVVLWLMGIV